MARIGGGLFQRLRQAESLLHLTTPARIHLGDRGPIRRRAYRQGTRPQAMTKPPTNRGRTFKVAGYGSYGDCLVGNVHPAPSRDARRSARRFMRYLLLLLALTVCTAHAKTPEETIRTYVDEIKVGGLGRIAGLMHPDELEKFRGMLRPFIDKALKEDEGRAEFGQFAEASDKTKQKQLSPEGFMSLFLTWFEGVQPQLSEVLKASTFEVIGHVKEGEVSHVVVRMRAKVEGVEIEQLSVMSTKDHQGTAKMMLSGEIKQMAEMLRSQR